MVAHILATRSFFGISVVTLLAAILYQLSLKDFLFTSVGVGRVIQQPSDFNATCETIEGYGLEGCEDMWLHEPSGLLYMACSDAIGRKYWLPS